MNRVHKLTGGFAFLGILILILDGKTALYGAQSGITLCIRTVIPSLFPFFLLSILLTGTLSGMHLPVLRPITKLLGMPEGTEALLITGFLGGYPTGAQSVASAYHRQLINKQNANKLLSFCNNAGPAFLFGMVGPMFSNRITPWILWFIHMGSALLAALLQPVYVSAPVHLPHKKTISLPEAMTTSIFITATVCGWIILFRVILAFLDSWVLWLFSPVVQVVIYGLLELSNGCCMLASVPSPELRFVLCSGMLAWGGFCVTLQTQSVTEGLSMGSYLKGKLLQTLFSLLLSASVVLKIWFPTAALLVFLSLLIQKTQNRGRNPAVVGV